MCVHVCVFAEIAGVHAELIISVTDGHLSSPGVDNLLRDGGLSEQDEHQPIYCIRRNESVLSFTGAQTVTEWSGW